ncbi:hypothetical protein BLNAU_3356 [Blattamonas nauphoetae]|uniref:Uncharacterized protein n=1 Tax=Blattamonas nauphoetae TaxID=2049346 RepID=A0ABQ9YCS7_9EUKA|nr:hypothetical protein BLNAU_3356 [Blattamonas nauphoetae]
MDCSPFLNWDGKKFESEDEKALVLRSLVATLKPQPALDASLETKAVTLLKYVEPIYPEAADAFLGHFASSTDESLTNFIQSIVVLLSSASQAITTAAIEMVVCFVSNCPAQIRIPLVKADLIPQLIITLNPQSLSFTEAVDIHSSLMNIIHNSVWLATPNFFRYLKVKDHDEQQAVHKMVLQQVLAPSEQYIRHLCVNRFSIIDGEQSKLFLDLFANLLQISPYYQPTKKFVLSLPVFLTIPSCLTFFENDKTIWSFLASMVNAQWKRNRRMDEEQRMWKTVHGVLGMEGIEDVIEEKLQNDKNTYGEHTVVQSMEWNNLQGMNLPNP